MADYSEKIAFNVAHTPSSEIIARVLHRSAMSFGLTPIFEATHTSPIASSAGAGAAVDWIELPPTQRQRISAQAAR